MAQDWYSNGDLQGDFKMSGKVEIIQQSEYDISDVEVQFKGLSQNSGYHVHLVSKDKVSLLAFSLPSNQYLSDTG